VVPFLFLQNSSGLVVVLDSELTKSGFATRPWTAASKPTAVQENWLKETLMAVHWIKDIDTGLSKAKSESKPVLVDFSAAPA
jgi:hypothetical protein